MCCSCTLRSFTLHVSSGSSHPSDLRCGWLIRRYPTMMFLIRRRWSTKSWDERKTWSPWGRGTKGQRERLLEPGFGPQALLKFKNGSISWDLDVVEVPQAQDSSGEPRIVFSWRAGRPWLAWLLEQHPPGLGHVNVTHSYIKKKKNIFPRLLVIRWEFVGEATLFRYWRFQVLEAIDSVLRH